MNFYSRVYSSHMCTIKDELITVLQTIKFLKRKLRNVWVKGYFISVFKKWKFYL